jgi:NADH dehydrogenase [ubiquinone] 1 alpha subcomplex assembly factor 7
MKILRELIEEKGHVTVAQFMELAMYDRVNGYYITQEPIGKNADFITAPEISQLFGEMIGLYCIEKWIQMGKPKAFNLVELGPGRATLMMDLIRATKMQEDFAQAMHIHLVETNRRLITVQREKLRGNKVIWHENISSLPSDKPLIIIANEFFDCLPISRFIKKKDNWHEQIISLLSTQDEYYFSHIPASLELSDSLNIEHPNARDGAIVEICYPAQQIIRHIAQILQKQPGFLLIVDYGYDFENKNRMAYDGSLQAVKNHKFHPVLSDIGRVDLTAHVDFYEIKKTARANFCYCSSTITQREFLINYGILMRAEMLSKNATDAQKNDIYSGLNRLISPLEMGKLFKVLEIGSSSFSKLLD